MKPEPFPADVICSLLPAQLADIERVASVAGDLSLQIFQNTQPQV